VRTLSWPKPRMLRWPLTPPVFFRVLRVPRFCDTLWGARDAETLHVGSSHHIEGSAEAFPSSVVERLGCPSTRRCVSKKPAPIESSAAFKVTVLL
jgi:hypothetical protein